MTKSLTRLFAAASIPLEPSTRHKQIEEVASRHMPDKRADRTTGFICPATTTGLLASEKSLLYLKRARTLVNDAAACVEQGSKTAAITNDDSRESIVQELRGIRLMLSVMTRQLTQFASSS
jgi:hypothetical protein